MKIEVEVRMILTVPNPKEDEQVEDMILAAEQFVNKLQGFNRSATGTAIGVRIHTHDYKEIS